LIRGQTTEISLNPLSAKDLKGEERFAPVQIDIRNVRKTKSGATVRRPGYLTKWTTTGNYPIIALIPEDCGYAVNTDGSVYSLTDTFGTLTNKIQVVTRPTWRRHNDLLMVAAGDVVKKLNGITVSNLTGAPRYAKWLMRVSTYTIAVGHDGTRFDWCDAGNPESWSGNFANVKKDSHIKYATELKEHMFFFKDRQIEVWGLGGAATFVRRDGSWIDRGLGAPESVVKAPNIGGAGVTLYWLGDDSNFYVLNGNTPISLGMSRELKSLSKPELIYGLHFPTEDVIRWIAPNEGRCFTFNYVTNDWSEDNRWQNGWERLPIYSAMEFKDRTYVGDYNPTGIVSEWSESYKTDNGDKIRLFRDWRVKVSPVKARINRLRLRVKRGNDSSGQMEISTKPDMIDRWKTESLDIGDIGDHVPYIDVFNHGLGRELRIQVSEMDAIDFLLTGMEITARQTGG
jgi:hypothetical protein